MSNKIYLEKYIQKICEKKRSSDVLWFHQSCHNCLISHFLARVLTSFSKFGLLKQFCIIFSLSSSFKEKCTKLSLILGVNLSSLSIKMCAQMFVCLSMFVCWYEEGQWKFKPLHWSCWNFARISPPG